MSEASLDEFSSPERLGLRADIGQWPMMFLFVKRAPKGKVTKEMCRLIAAGSKKAEAEDSCFRLVLDFTEAGDGSAKQVASAVPHLVRTQARGGFNRVDMTAVLVGESQKTIVGTGLKIFRPPYPVFVYGSREELREDVDFLDLSTLGLHYQKTLRGKKKKSSRK